MSDFVEVKPPALPKTLPSVAQFQGGPPVAPIARLMIYSPDDWESFIEEWVSAALSTSYKSVARFTGGGDKGIDIAGFADADGLQGIWTTSSASTTRNLCHQRSRGQKLAKSCGIRSRATTLLLEYTISWRLRALGLNSVLSLRMRVT